MKRLLLILTLLTAFLSIALCQTPATTIAAAEALVPDSLKQKAEALKPVAESLIQQAGSLKPLADSLKPLADSLAHEAVEYIVEQDKPLTEEEHATIDSLMAKKVDKKTEKQPKDWSKWSPNPKRALWLALVLPGAGQIYNRKYWKLPIIYGGVVGCLYAWRWNEMMYTDYSRAYSDLLDNNPETESYNKFMHLGVKIDDTNKSRYEDLFRRRKDMYRRYRDLSIFCLIAVYALSVIDAYVDASLSQFDISKDLSLKVKPTIMKSQMTYTTPLQNNSLGFRCEFKF